MISLRLRGFKYLRRQRILTLFLITTLSSMLFSTTALSLLSFYRGFTSYLGEEEDVVVVYDRRSSTPFTGLVPAYLSERISSLNGVLASSPEVIVPCILKGRPTFLRGVVPEDLARLNRITMIEGSMLRLDDMNSIIVGKNAAERLNIKLGERILVLGVLTDRYLELQVKGIFLSHSPMDDEVLAPLYIGQWLRGIDYSYVTLIRFKIDRKVIAPSAILGEIAGKEQQEAPGQAPKSSNKAPIGPSIARIVRPEEIGVKEAYNFMRSYMERYGVTREVLLVLSATIFLLSSASMTEAFRTILAQHREEMNILRDIGASKKLLKRDIMAKLLPWSIAASSLGFVMALAFLIVVNRDFLVLSHTPPLVVDPLVVVLNFLLPLLLMLGMD